MRFSATIIALAALVSITVAAAVHPPCKGPNKCGPEGALVCANLNEWGQMLFWCENGCWTLKQACRKRCENEPEPHCT